MTAPGGRGLFGRRAPTVLRPLPRAGLGEPHKDVFTPPPAERQLPMRQTSVAASSEPSWLFVAAHGGSGARLLAQLSWQPYEAALDAAVQGETVDEWPGYGMCAGRAWPDPELEPTAAVVVVCRTTMRGLAWARDLAAQYLSGQAPERLQLLGLVTIADVPGRLPPTITASRGLVAGAYTQHWAVPYVPEYRLLTGLPDEPRPPLHPAVADVLAEIRTLTSKGPLS